MLGIVGVIDYLNFERGAARATAPAADEDSPERSLQKKIVLRLDQLIRDVKDFTLVLERSSDAEVLWALSMVDKTSRDLLGSLSKIDSHLSVGRS